MYLPLLFSVLALGISFFSLLYFKSYLKRRTGQERILSEIREEVSKILRSIDETTDRDISLIEEREKVLKNLLEDIEKRLKVYIREMDKRHTPPRVDLGIAPANRYPANTQVNTSPENVEAAESSSVPDRTQSPAFRLPSFSVKQGPSSSQTVGEQINELVRAGFSAPVIASRLGLSIAEVEFAVALLERRDNPTTTGT